MGKGTIEKFGLKAIADALRGSDVESARDRLSQLVGAAVEVSGTVQKRVKRDGQCKNLSARRFSCANRHRRLLFRAFVLRLAV